MVTITGMVDADGQTTNERISRHVVPSLSWSILALRAFRFLAVGWNTFVVMVFTSFIILL